jgi:hypothetical protein
VLGTGVEWCPERQLGGVEWCPEVCSFFARRGDVEQSKQLGKAMPSRLLTPLQIRLLLAISQNPGNLGGPIVLHSNLGHITNLGRHNAQNCKMLSKMRVCQRGLKYINPNSACPTPKRYPAHSSGRIMHVRFDVINFLCTVQKFVPSSQVAPQSIYSDARKVNFFVAQHPSR